MNTIIEEVRSALWTVWNRRWQALAVAWGVCLLGWLVVALIPNAYDSKTRIFVQLDDALAQQIGIGSSTREKDILRVQQTLTSAVNLEKVIRSTRIGDDITTPAQMERAVQALAKKIVVVAQGENLFEITATSGRSDLSDAENAQLAQDIANRMIDIFRESNLGESRGEMRDTITFLDQQLAERSRQLEEAEQKRLAFESEHPDLAGGTEAISAKINANRDDLRAVQADLAAAKSALAAIDGQLASTPRTLVTADGGGPKAALAQAQSNLAALQARGLTDSHPDVVAVKKQIAALRIQTQGAGGDYGTPNPAYTSLQGLRIDRQATVEALSSRAAAIQSELANFAASQAKEPTVAAEAQRISRDYDVLRQQYDKLLQDREELRLRGQVETERSAIKFEVIDPPSTPRVPSWPNRPILLFAVLFLGLCAGGGTAYLLGRMRSSFATAGRLEETFQLPVVGTISLALTDAARALHKLRMRRFTAASAGLGVLFLVLLIAEFVQRGTVA
ncbi:XrtA system polysaccharide chain length determinant [Croceibacterium aestuarii]|uniref:XrtA system polysaccharide chain length determinant n=1 Tax=Croceibacterium aestuarii TaxID=3064139 RepID=UPI00272E7828|nr:XrtA system polysaccharide chain length determinant [Croceibacterium sp. D39]